MLRSRGSLLQGFHIGSGAYKAASSVVTGMKQSTPEADHSLPSHVNVKNQWKYTSTT